MGTETIIHPNSVVFVKDPPHGPIKHVLNQCIQMNTIQVLIMSKIRKHPHSVHHFGYKSQYSHWQKDGQNSQVRLVKLTGFVKMNFDSMLISTNLMKFFKNNNTENKLHFNTILVKTSRINATALPCLHPLLFTWSCGHGPTWRQVAEIGACVAFMWRLYQSGSEMRFSPDDIAIQFFSTHQEHIHTACWIEGVGPSRADLLQNLKVLIQ